MSTATEFRDKLGVGEPLYSSYFLERTSVSGLFFLGCPPTIPRLIVTVHIDAVDRMSGGRLTSHVS